MQTGAVGDGKADDTAAFEAAIVRAKKNGLTVRVVQMSKCPDALLKKKGLKIIIKLLVD
jgi:polygalacturonase